MIAEKRNRRQRRNWSLGLGFMLMLVVGALAVSMYNPEIEEIPVFNEKLVIRLPQTQIKEETIQLPYDQGEVAVGYFDGISTEVPTVVEFEGVYRPSQGIDIVWQNEAFPVKAALSGDVIDVVSDYLLGQSISIQSGNMTIIYQSLDGIRFQKGDTVKQGEIIANAGSNVYQSSLNNHLHLVVEKDGKVIDPGIVFNMK